MSFVNDNIVRAVDNAQATNAGLSSTATASGIDGLFGNSLIPVPVPTFKVPRTFADNYAIAPSSNAEAMPDPHLVTPYVQQWNLGVQHTIWDTLIDVRYVGNHSTKSIRGFDYNQIVISQLLPDFLTAANNGWLALTATGSFNPAYNANIAGSKTTPFISSLPNGGYLSNSTVRSYLQTGQVGELANWYMTNRVNGTVSFYTNPSILGGNVLTNYSNSSYHGLQIDAMHRFKNGVQFQLNYSFSKVLSDAAGNGQTDFEPFLDIHNAKLERKRVVFDLTHVIKGNFYYELPFGKGKRFNFQNRILSKVIDGWNVAGIYTSQSGPPISVVSGRGTLNRSGRSGNNMANTTATLGQLRNLFQLYKDGNGVWFYPQANKNPVDGRAVAPDGSAAFSGQMFSQPAAGTLGGLQGNLLSGPWVWTMDAKISKVARITETKTVELRMDAINVFNHDTFYIGDQTVTSTNFGRISSYFYNPRVLQFALYLHF